MQSTEASLHKANPLPRGPLSQHPWLTFLLPFLVFALSGSLEPQPPDTVIAANTPTAGWFNGGLPYEAYPIIYTVRIALTALTMWWVWPGYRTFPFHISPWALLVGIGGAFLWVGITALHLETKFLGPWGLGWLVDLGERAGFNPLIQMKAHGLWAYAFLAIRFFGLVLVVPVIEEFFLRGFLMRFVTDQNWWKLPIGRVSRTALVVGSVFPALYHPAEMVAALAWFSAVTWLMLRTKNLWDCVAAHMLTNLLLGFYVLATNNWWLL